MNTHPSLWTPERLDLLGRRLEGRSPGEILHWGFELFAPDIAQATGFGASGTVLLDMVARLRPETVVFYLDTDLLFPETHALRVTLEQRYGIRFVRVATVQTLDEQAEAHGPELWRRAPDVCCNLRKVEPLRRFLTSRRAWITGLRRDQSATRRRIGIVEWDYANGLVKLNPLAEWTEDDVRDYIRRHDLPYNTLQDAGFASIGCIPCTRAVTPGEDSRSGRWHGHEKTECGIHQAPAAILRAS
jgi:phosphoadenosine phosphosulfate reductase